MVLKVCAISSVTLQSEARLYFFPLDVTVLEMNLAYKVSQSIFWGWDHASSG